MSTSVDNDCVSPSADGGSGSCCTSGANNTNSSVSKSNTSNAVIQYHENEKNPSNASPTILPPKKSSCCDANRDGRNPSLSSAQSCCAGTVARTEPKPKPAKSCCDGNNDAKGSCCSSKSIPDVKPRHDDNQDISISKRNPCCEGGDNGAPCASTAHPQTPSTDSSEEQHECCDGTRSVIECISGKDPDSTCCNDDNHNNSKRTGACSAPSNKGCCVMTHTCIAIVHSNNSAVDIFDTKGRSRTFHIKARRNINMSEKRLCFSTHGAGGGIDGMVTPCFDSNGEHEEPDEGCPCGVEEEHLHAHIYDPDICSIADNKCASGAAARKKATSWRFLSQLTLYPDDAKTTSYMPITESMPKECNSGALERHLTEEGLWLSHWLRWNNNGNGMIHCNKHGTSTMRNEESGCGVSESCKKPRLYPIRHEDHTDFLVHNEAKGELYMEHPNCTACGESDIHGRFRLVHTRRWTVDANKSRIHLHFFEVNDEPFRLLDVLSSLFDSESSRVHAMRPVSATVTAVPEEELPPSPSSRVGRSQFFVDGICCASEIPQVESILRPMKGVVEMSINPTTRTVYVDHDVDVTSAKRIANALGSQGFSAVVKNDAAVALDQMAGIPTDVFVESKFDLTGVSKVDSEDDTGKIVDVIQACLGQKFSEEQVKNVTAIEQNNILMIEHNPYYLTASGIAAVLASSLNGVELISDGGADGMWALTLMKENTDDTIEDQSSSVRWPVILSGVFWFISMLSLIGGNWDYLKYMALLSVAFGLPPIVVKAFRTLRRCRFDVNCMMLFAAVGALPLQEYTESAAVTFLFAISEALETRATSRARNALSAIVCLRPERANVINPATKDIVVLPASAVAVGTLVSVRTGDKVPCDGIVIDGTSTIDESSLTGESRPVNKSPGMSVSGGTINTGNTQLVIKTTATSNNSAVSRLIRLVEEAQSNRSDTEKLVDSFAKIYTPIIVLTALCMCTVPWAFGAEVGTTWAKNGLITIVIACPCALIISTPVTYVAGLAASAQKGVIVKGGQHLEALGRVKNIAFDKTGTLSRGVFELLHFNVVGQTRSRKEVFEYLALMEAPASHPLSDAIVKGAANEQIEIPRLQLKNHTLLPGEGITANVAGKDVHVGNKKLFQRLSMYDALKEDVKVATEGWARDGGTIGFISIEGEGIIGAYCVADKIRDEAQDVVKALKKMGIKIIMLTGDQRPAAIGIGSQIGLDEQDIKSELLPENKLTEIGDTVEDNEMKKKCWRAKRAVMMVGDGVNDAPALALADVSVAMGEGAALAMDTADVTLMDSNLNKLLYIICMGRRVIRTIIENVLFSLIVKAVVMGFTFAGKASLWAAIASDVGAMLIVTLNGMKLLPRKTKESNLPQGSFGEIQTA